MKKTYAKDSPDPIDKYVGSRVRTRRVGMRLSQTDLGRAIGVSFQQVQKYENAANRVSASSLYKIAKVLGVDVAYFYDGMAEYVPKARGKRGRGLSESFDEDPMRSREAIELMHNYFRIGDSELRGRLFKFVKALTK